MLDACCGVEWSGWTYYLLIVPVIGLKDTRFSYAGEAVTV